MKIGKKINITKPSPRTLQLVGLVMFVLLCVAAYLLYQSHKEAALRQDKIRYEQSKIEANKLRGQRQNDQAIKVLNDYIKVAIDDRNKIYTYVKIGTIHEVQKQYDQALAAYRQAEKLSKNDDRAIAVGIARSSYALGDKQTAIKYYRICIRLLEEGNQPALQQDADHLKKTVSRIESEL